MMIDSAYIVIDYFYYHYSSGKTSRLGWTKNYNILKSKR